MVSGIYKRTDFHKKAISKSLKGRIITWGNEISIAKKGIPNLKLSETRKRLFKEGKLKNSLKGVKRLDISERLKKDNPMFKLRTNNGSFKKGHKVSEKCIKSLKDSRKNQIFPIKDTKIEIKIQNFLKELGITFFTHQYIKQIEHSYQCDIFIPSFNLVIECDGDYWHKYPIGKDIDKIRTTELIEKGFKILRLWENEIEVMNLNNFKNHLKHCEEGK